MRFKFSDYSPGNKREYVMAVGKKDIEILLGLVQNAKNTMPHLRATQENNMYHEIRSRVSSMRKALSRALDEAESLGDDDKRRKIFKSGDKK